VPMSHDGCSEFEDDMTKTLCRLSDTKVARTISIVQTSLS